MCRGAKSSVFALLALILSGLGAACTSNNETILLPEISFNVVTGTRITTNNFLNRNLIVQGQITNMDPGDPAAYQVLSDIGVFPSAAPGGVLSVTGAGDFAISLTDPLINTASPLSEASTGNTLQVAASNDKSPVNINGTPIPITRTLLLYVDNQVVFTSPLYAYADPMDATQVLNDCDLMTSNIMTGTFSLPVGTTDATTVITNAYVISRDAANLFEDPMDTGFDAARKPLAITAMGVNMGDFTVTIDNMNWEDDMGGPIAFDPAGLAQADANFFLRFDTTNPKALPAPGTLVTFPFQGCIF